MSDTKHVAVRFDTDTLARIDALIPTLSTSWRKAKRSDAIRAAVVAGLPILERPVAEKPAKPGRTRGA